MRQKVDELYSKMSEICREQPELAVMAAAQLLFNRTLVSYHKNSKKDLPVVLQEIAALLGEQERK